MTDMIMTVGRVGRQSAQAWRRAWQVVTHWVVNVVTDGIVWIGVLMTASALGLLLEAIYDTVRWGHPR